MKAVKVIKKTGKILLITFLSLLLLVIVLLVIALNSENTIARLALKEVSKMIDAPVKVENVSLHIFRDFPYATVEFNEFSVGEAYDTQPELTDTTEFNELLTLRKLYVAVRTMPLLKSKVEIKRVEIEGFAFNYHVDSLGVSNIDFLMATDTTMVEPEVEEDVSESILDVLLSDLTVRDITVFFKDEKLKAKAQIHIPEMDISGRVLDEYYAGTLRGSISLSNSSFNGTNLFLMDETSLGFSLEYDDGDVKIESLTFLTDGAKITASGNAKIADSIFVDMGIKLLDVDFKELSKYATQEMLDEFGLIGVEGILNIETHIKGYVYDTILLPSVEATIAMKNGSVQTVDYPNIKHLSFNGKVSVPDPNNMQTMGASFRAVRLATDRSNFNFAVDVTNFEKPTYDVKSNAVITLDEFAGLIPENTVEHLSGRITYTFSTRGVLPDDLGMNSADYFLARTSLDVKVRDFATALDSVDQVKNLNADFTYKPDRSIVLKDLSLEAPGYNVVLDNFTVFTKLLGSVSDMDNMGVDIDSMYVKMGGNIIDAKATLRGLAKPTYTLTSNVQVDLDELMPFVPDSLVEHMAGKVSMTLNSYGTVDLDSMEAIEASVMPIAFEQTDIKIKVRDFAFEMFEDTLTRVNSLNLDLAMANDTIRVDNFYANAHGVDLWVDSTEVWNVYKAFLLEQKDKHLIVNTHIRVSDLDYAKFEHLLISDTTQVEEQLEQLAELSEENPLTEEAEEAEQQEQRTEQTLAIEAADDSETLNDTIQETAPMYIPPFIVRGTMAISSVKYEDIVLTDLSTKFRVDDSLYVADDFRLKAFGGEMISSVVYDTRQDTIHTVMFRNRINGMDIRQLLIDANEFEQDYFTSRNVSGVLTSFFDGRMVFDKDFDLPMDRIMIRGNFKLEDGGIYDFEPMMELGRFTNLRELDNIIFRTMESSVFIYRNNIYFPKTDIVSTALDASLYGMQSFGEDYQYHLVVFPGDVMFGKTDGLLARQGRESDIFEGEDLADRRGLHLVSLKRDGSSRHGFDNRRLQRTMTTTIRLQERGLSLIFNPRLTNYSTDLDRQVARRRQQEEDKTEEEAENEDQ